MKSALVRITSKMLAKFFGLRDGVYIDAVFQDAEDHVGDSFSFRVRGAGKEHGEGHIGYHCLSEFIEEDFVENGSEFHVSHDFRLKSTGSVSEKH